MIPVLKETDVQDFWQHHPCGDVQVGGLNRFHDNYASFFNEYDDFRYANEPHILTCLDEIDFVGKRTLEIGLGQGADSEQIIRRGAMWSGVDLTHESVQRVQKRLSMKALPYEALKQGSVLALPFEDNSFDVVFSHGVLHHVPDIAQAQREIGRVLTAEGKLIVMLYAKYSINYLFSIAIVRRLGLAAVYLTDLQPEGIVGQHVSSAREVGLFEYLKLNNFIHKNTDGPLNPYSKVYDLKTVRQDFSEFRILKSSKHLMHAPPLNVEWLPLAKYLGWHLWVHMQPRN